MITLDHIGLYVSDIEAAKTFFTTYLDAIASALYRNEKKGFCSYFLTLGDASRIEIMTRTGIDGSKEAVDALTERLRADGYEVTDGPRTTGDGCYESCIAAIDGNLIEITE